MIQKHTTLFLLSWPFLGSECYAVENTYPNDYLFENIENHGAVANDGIDDTAAIRSALNSASSKSKKVLIPRGKFEIHSTIELVQSKYDNIQIEGSSGWNSTIYHRGGSTAFAIGNGIAESASYRVIFRNFHIKSDAENPVTISAIHFNRSHWGLIDNMRIQGYSNSGHTGAAVKYESTWEHSIINSVFVENDVAIYAEQKQIPYAPNQVNALNVENCLIEGIRWGGIHLHNTSGANITNNTIEGKDVKKHGVLINVGANINVSGNYFEGFSSSIIEIDKHAYNRGININNNYMSISEINTQTPDYHISAKNVAGLNVSGNTFINKPKRAFLRIGHALLGRDINIGPNTIYPLPDVSYWSGLKYFETMDPEGGNIDKPFYYGFIYDMRLKRWVYGSQTNPTPLQMN